MYEEFYGFQQPPFNLTPDSEFIYYSDQHKEALAKMLYGVQERKGLILVTGRVGSGKTTLCRAFLKELKDTTKSALVLNTKMNASELIRAVADDLSVQYGDPASDESVVEALQEFARSQFKRDRNVCVVVDESQNLEPRALRLLNELRTGPEGENLIQVVLVGQPELEQLMNRPELREVKQEISVRTYLSNLAEQDLEPYVRHRISTAQPEHEPSFDSRVYDGLYTATGGNPRGINLLCDRMLLAAYTDETTNVQLEHLQRAKRDLAGDDQLKDETDRRLLHRVRSEQMSGTNQSWGEQLRRPVVVGLVCGLAVIGMALGLKRCQPLNQRLQSLTASKPPGLIMNFRQSAPLEAQVREEGPGVVFSTKKVQHVDL